MDCAVTAAVEIKERRSRKQKKDILQSSAVSKTQGKFSSEVIVVSAQAESDHPGSGSALGAPRICLFLFASFCRFVVLWLLYGYFALFLFFLFRLAHDDFLSTSWKGLV